MAITKEYICPGHGPFESDTPRCPSGCTIVSEREFRTPPAFHNGVTQRTDALVRSQVEAFGLSNIRSAREGEVSRPNSESEQRIAGMNQRMKAIGRGEFRMWGDMPQGGTLNVQTGQVEGGDKGGGAIAAAAQHHAEVNPSINAVRGAKPAYQAVRDPQALRVDTSKAA